MTVHGSTPSRALSTGRYVRLLAVLVDGFTVKLDDSPPYRQQQQRRNQDEENMNSLTPLAGIFGFDDLGHDYSPYLNVLALGSGRRPSMRADIHGSSQ